MNEVLNRINDIRNMCGLSKNAFAEKIGVSVNTIYNWYRTDSMPTLAVVERICKLANMTEEQFFGGIKKKEKSPESEFIYKWRLLTDCEKRAAEGVMDAFAELRSAVIS